eukprot:754381-Hanusia_phi.AAC.2
MGKDGAEDAVSSHERSCQDALRRLVDVKTSCDPSTGDNGRVEAAGAVVPHRIFPHARRVLLAQRPVMAGLAVHAELGQDSVDDPSVHIVEEIDVDEDDQQSRCWQADAAEP